MSEFYCIKADCACDRDINEAYIRGYNTAVDEFAKMFYNKSTELKNIESDDYGLLNYEDVYKLAEQLKAKTSNFY